MLLDVTFGQNLLHHHIYHRLYPKAAMVTVILIFMVNTYNLKDT